MRIAHANSNLTAGIKRGKAPTLKALVWILGLPPFSPSLSTVHAPHDTTTVWGVVLMCALQYIYMYAESIHITMSEYMKELCAGKGLRPITPKLVLYTPIPRYILSDVFTPTAISLHIFISDIL